MRYNEKQKGVFKIEILEKIINAIFPPVCAFCGQTSLESVCKECLKKMQNCEKSRIDKYLDKNFESHIYLFKYEEPIREQIIEYKFRNKPYYYKTFTKILINNKKIYDILKSYDIIIPVPMTYKKIKERGYNQTQLIARLITENIESLTLKEDILIKYKENNTQSKLTKQQRVENVKDVYKLRNNKIIKGKNVLIFDDVYTTGATCNECAKTLIKANTNKIGVMTIAKDYNKTQKID